MTDKKKMVIYISTLIISILMLTLFFIFLPDGIFGFITVLLGFYLLLGSIIKLCKLNPKFKNTFWAFMDLLFWLP
ncbi:MAG: hypothetical protein IJ565_05610 [Bacilli bacterium]|nr:hypothetical protein [Bacilli bacterium]